VTVEPLISVSGSFDTISQLSVTVRLCCCPCEAGRPEACVDADVDTAPVLDLVADVV
jgi:hypothetical protein